MIWEVDEDCDGFVNWPEFQAMWQRCREDKAGALRNVQYMHAGSLFCSCGRSASPIIFDTACWVQTMYGTPPAALPTPHDPHPHQQAPSLAGSTTWCSSCCTLSQAPRAAATGWRWRRP